MIDDTNEARFCTGKGQNFTNIKTGVDYETISWADILGMAKEPTSFKKEDSWWVIASTYVDFDARNKQRQLEVGRFGLLPFDIDKGNKTLDEVENAFNEALGSKIQFLIYSTNGATETNKKWRVKVPLGALIGGPEYQALLHVINNMLEDRCGLILDRKLESPNQLVYLPNRGEFYEHRVSGSEQMTVPLEKIHQSVKIFKEQFKKAHSALDRAYEPKPLIDPQTGMMSALVAFCLQNSIEAELGFYGCEQKGCKWLPPNSKSGNAGISILPSERGPWDVTYCHHDSEPDLFERICDPAEIRILTKIKTGKAANRSKATGQLFHETKAIDPETGKVLEMSVHEFNNPPATANNSPFFDMGLTTGEEATAIMEHLIDPWFPKGIVMGVYGRGESGKSSWVSSLCAEASDQISTLWISSEEAKANIEVRYTKSGGHLNTLIAMTATPKLAGKEQVAVFDAYEHLEKVIIDAQGMVHSTRPLGAVVLDAVGALVTWKPGENENNDGAVKRLLAHLHSLSERHGITIVIIGHMNKNTNKVHGADAVTGSAAWTNSVRRAFMFYKDVASENDYEFFIRTAKANTGTHFAASYKTVPVHTLHERPGVACNEVLCRIEYTSEIAWGRKAVNELLNDSEDEDPYHEAKQKRKSKKQAVLDVVASAVKTGGCTSRAEIKKYAAGLDVSLSNYHFKNYAVDDYLTKNCGVSVERAERGQMVYK